MFKWVIKRQNSHNIHEFEFDKVTDFYKETPIYQKVEDFTFSQIFESIDYDIVALKPVKDDFLILFTNKVMWEFFGENFSKYMEGRLIGELFPFFKTSHFIKHLKEAYKNDTQTKYFFKMYEDENLIFAGKQYAIKQDDILFVLVKDQTEIYLRREREEKIYNKSPFPVLLMNDYGEITQANNSFFKLSDYSLDELNPLGLETIFKTFKPKTLQVKSFTEALNIIFENRIPIFDFEVEIITKNRLSKWLTVHMRLLTSDTVRLTLRDIDDKNKQKLIVENLMDYFSDLEGSKNTFFQVFDGEKFHYTENVYNILEIDSNIDLSTGSSRLFTDFILPEYREDALSKTYELLETGKPVSLEYKIKTGKDNIKTLKTDLKAFKDAQIYYGFTRDKTIEYSNKKAMDKLKKNLNTIQSNSKVGISVYKDGIYYYSPEVYSILGIDSKEYETGVDIFKDYVQTEGRDGWFEVMSNLSPENHHAHKVTNLKNAKGEDKIIDNIIDAEFDSEGELVEYTSFIRDITEEELTKKQALRLTEDFELIQESSKIGLARYENGEYTWTSEIYNMLKISPNDYPNSVNLIDEFIIPEDRERFRETFNVTVDNPDNQITYCVCNNEGEFKYLNVHNKAKFDDNGELSYITGFIQDVTEETIIKESALELQNNLSIIQDASKICIAHYKNGEYSWTSEIYNILEISPEDYPENSDLLRDFIVPENIDNFIDYFNHKSPENPNFNDILTVKTVNGDFKYLELYVESKFDDEGNFIEFVSFIHEVTDKVLRERELESLLEDRKLLLQEVHHRVKNNLQLINSFLNLDARYYSDRPGYVIEKTHTRIDAMATTHEEVYKSSDVSHINVESLLSTVLSDLFSRLSSKNIRRVFDVESEIYVDIDRAMPLSFFVSELAVNSINHAFPDNKSGNFYVKLISTENNDILHVWDDGVGLPEGLDILSSDTLGFTVIRRLTEQLEAELNVLEDVPGFGVELILPKV